MPPMQPVDSSSIEAVGYDPQTRELHVRFVGGGLYVYGGVDRTWFDGLLRAESKGRYFNQEIKPRGFSYERRG